MEIIDNPNGFHVNKKYDYKQEVINNANTKIICFVTEEYAATPDGMAVAPNGDLVLSCPNFADPSKPGRLLRFDGERMQ